MLGDSPGFGSGKITQNVSTNTVFLLAQHAKTNEKWLTLLKPWTGWWLNQPIFKKILVKMGYSTIFGVKIKIYVQPPPREILNVWLSWIVWTDPFHASSFPSKKEGPDMCILLPHPKEKTPAVHKSCVDVIVASSKHPNKSIPQGNNQPGNTKSQNNQRWDSTNLNFWFLFLSNQHVFASLNL